MCVVFYLYPFCGYSYPYHICIVQGICKTRWTAEVRARLLLYRGNISLLFFQLRISVYSSRLLSASLYYLTCSSCVVQHIVYSIAAYCWKEDCNSVLKRILSEKAFTFSSLTVPPFFCDTAGQSKKQVLVVAIGRVRYMSMRNIRFSQSRVAY